MLVTDQWAYIHFHITFSETLGSTVLLLAINIFPVKFYEYGKLIHWLVWSPTEMLRWKMVRHCF